MKGKRFNRNGDEYWFDQIDKNRWQFKMTEDCFSMKHCRIGGKEGQKDIDYNDLGFFDPSGGPFVSVGDKLFGKDIINLTSNGSGFIITLGT